VEPSVAFAEIRLVVRCVDAGEAIERMPEPQVEIVAGAAIPLAQLNSREASAPAKLRRALVHLGG
jgi:hypothetical protein